MKRSQMSAFASVILSVIALGISQPRASFGQLQPAAIPMYLDALQVARSKTEARSWAEAAAAWEKVVALNPVNGAFWQQLASANYNAKNYSASTKAYEKAGELGSVSAATAAYNIACNYALLGEKDQALQWVEKAIDLGFPDLMHIQSDSDLHILHDNARFQEITGLRDTSKMSREEGWRYDLQLLVREVKRKAFPTFRGAPEREFDVLATKLRSDIPKMSDPQIIVQMSKLMRTVGDGHSGLLGGRRAEFTNTLPLHFYLFEEGLFIIAADPKYKELVGSQVVKFGPSTVDQVVNALDTVVSRDNKIWIKQVAPYRMRNVTLLNSLSLVPDNTKVTLSLRGPDGKERVETVASDSSQPDIWNIKPGPAGWDSVTKMAAGPVPLYLKNPSEPYWFEYLPEARTVFFQFNSVRNNKTEPLALFCERLFKFVEDNAVDKLVIDLRWNNGGNTGLVAPIIQGLIRSEKINRRGKLFVVIGRRTYSAAQNTATFLERNTNAVFVGEPTGSSPNFVGEEDPFVMPYSKIAVNVSDLYWESSFPQDKRKWIAPLIYLPPTFEAYKANRDPVMEAILGYK